MLRISGTYRRSKRNRNKQLGAQVFGINKDTKLAKEAFDLITFLTKGEYDQKLADETVGIPADTTNTEWPAMVECAKPVIEQSTNRFTWACGVESNVDMTPVIKENFIKLMAGSITADEFCFHYAGRSEINKEFIEMVHRI